MSCSPSTAQQSCWAAEGLGHLKKPDFVGQGAGEEEKLCTEGTLKAHARIPRTPWWRLGYASKGLAYPRLTRELLQWGWEQSRDPVSPTVSKSDRILVQLEQRNSFKLRHPFESTHIHKCTAMYVYMCTNVCTHTYTYIYLEKIKL